MPDKKNKILIVPLFEIEKSIYCLRLEKSICLALAMLIIVPLVWRRTKSNDEITKFKPILTMENLDLTPHVRRRGTPAPLRPEIPIPVEDAFISPEETITMTDLDLGNINAPDFPDYEMTGDESDIGDEGISAAAQLNEKGYVKLSILVNAAGYVDSVLVLENTCMSKVFEICCFNTAYRTEWKDNKKKQWLEKIIWYKDPKNFR